MSGNARNATAQELREKPSDSTIGSHYCLTMEADQAAPKEVKDDEHPDHRTPSTTEPSR
jgi:hypothetical protein